FQENIPKADMTKLEFLLLSNIFESVEEEGGIYFYSSEGAQDFVWAQKSELIEAIEESRGYTSQVLAIVEEQLAKLTPDEDELELDMSGMSWEHMIQDIVRRSATLRYISVAAAFTCSKMRSDGFGGMAVFVTAENIKWFSTTEFLTDCLAEIVGGDDQE
ncbi:MAG: hypothetical protein KGL65_10720, partial [Rhodospirillales bacterium]|nr:hypothetical protein [Rhodospirillales bacterium]